MKNFNQLSILFDMDGVIADTMHHHSLAWIEFCKKRGMQLTKKRILHEFSGRVNDEILERLFKRKLSKKEINKYISEKEALYRKIYRPHVKPVKGLLKFLESLKKNGVKIAMATAAPEENVKFILPATKTKKYFKTIVNASHVKLGKPAPDIYLKAAKAIKAKPIECIVIEDALNGIEAARRAKMKVVGIATSHKPSEIKHADLVVKDFTKLNLEKLTRLIS